MIRHIVGRLADVLAEFEERAGYVHILGVSQVKAWLMGWYFRGM